MPRVPSYDNFQAQETVNPTVQFQAPSGPTAGSIVAEQQGQMGRAMQGAGSEINKIAIDAQQQANQLRVEDVAAQLDKIKLDRQIKALSLTGRAALERPNKQSLIDEEAGALDRSAQELAASLGNNAQKVEFQKYAARLSNQYRGQIGSHVIQQQGKFEEETQTGKLNTAVNKAGLLAADPVEVKDSRDKVEQVVQWQINKLGLTPAKDAELISDIRTKAMSQLHGAVLAGLLKPNSSGMALTTQAQEYYRANSAEMTLQARANAQDALNQATTSEKAQSIGQDLAARFDYTQTAQAQLELDKMDLPPNVKVAARAELEHRHAIKQSDADKSQAIQVSKVMEMVYSGKSPAAVLADPLYQGLRDKGAVLKAIQDYQYTQVLRANANDARALGQLQRQEAEMHIRGAAKAFEFMDPTVLAATPREKIALQLPILGRQWTELLLNRKDSQEKRAPDDVKVDHDDMMAAMEEMKLKPFEKNKNEEGKALIATTQSRIERALTEAQAGGAKLSREQKNKLIREEIAKTVTVNGSIFGSLTSDKKPVVELTPDDLKRVQIPASEYETVTLPDGKKRAGIQDEMAELYKLSGGKDKRYEPTPENLARFYLNYRSGSATAKFIPGNPNAK